MKLQEIDVWRQPVALVRPYTIASRTISAVDLIYLRLIADDGTIGLGSASPAAGVTGESIDDCLAALSDDRLAELRGEDPRQLGRLLRRVHEMTPTAPAARAALDIALHDLVARKLEVPLVDLLGQRRAQLLPTSITVGIQSTEEALADVDEYLGRGFRVLKVKIGRDLAQDRERLHEIRQRAGRDAVIRVDGNQGYAVDDLEPLAQLVDELDLELVEQPLPRVGDEDLRSAPEALRHKIAADESVHDGADAYRLAAEPSACGIFNIKLMKSGGIGGALDIARVAELAGQELMWGCMDESAISIAAALHAAYACPRTRYLDLDGSFDLADDLASGGFEVKGGVMRLTGGPGLGVTLRD